MIGKKAKDWIKAKKRLMIEYEEEGITVCEACGGTFAMSFHHLERRSSGRAKHTFEGTRLLCAECHDKADNRPGHREFNDKLKLIR